jgi:disulfide bond formation protein DsbB
MKCFKHDTDAVAVCPYCGRGLCPSCSSAITFAAPRLACSDECAKALTRNEGVLHLLLQKSRQSARANSVYCYLCGGLSAGAAVAAWFWLPVPMLMWFLAASAVALIISGVWFGRGAGKMNS